MTGSWDIYYISSNLLAKWMSHYALSSLLFTFIVDLTVDHSQTIKSGQTRSLRKRCQVFCSENVVKCLANALVLPVFSVFVGCSLPFGRDDEYNVFLLLF